MRRLACILAAAAALGGCMVGPSYQKPALPTPPAFSEQPGTPQATATDADLSRWWTALGDPELSSLIDRALAQNLDVATAVARVDEARAAVTVVRAPLFPSVNATTSAIDASSHHGAASGSGGVPVSGGAGGVFGIIPSNLHQYSLGADATWELDIFGGVRRGVEAARAQAAAAEWQARDAQVAVSAEVARAYLSLRQAQARRAQALADVARISDLMSLVSARSRSGLVTELDVNQQRQTLQARQAEIPQLDQQARSAIHALSVLIAQPPAALDAELAPARPLPAQPTALPVGLPAELLLRRPDIRAAERQLAAATAEIGVAIAQRYPKIDLLGLASFASPNLGDLLSARNFTSVGTGFAIAPIFDAGRRRATVEERRAQATQADLAYRKAWLTALRDVDDALAAYRTDTQREALLAQDLQTAQDSATLSNARYRAGLTPFLDVLQAEGAVNQAEDDLIQARSARIGDTIALFSALGGGWTQTPGTAARP